MGGKPGFCELAIFTKQWQVQARMGVPELSRGKYSCKAKVFLI
jgi:hypothetical protein